MSFVAALPENQRAEWLAQVAALVDAGETPPSYLFKLSSG